MLNKNPNSSLHHISDEELVRSADGELPAGRDAEVEAHLQACWDCRARMQEIQSAIAGFVRAHHTEYDAQLPPVAGPRALLRARLAQASSEPQMQWWERAFQFGFGVPRVAAVCLSLIAAATGAWWFQQSSHGAFRSSSVLSDAPNRSLTPGATRQVTLNEVCAVPREEVIGDVSASMRQQVFREYGIANARPEDYEIDYLIAPRLGGTEDIRNLWPEPYRTREWNAHVKDALEERLHEMVCNGQVDLSTAQHDIATDWIAAYKKYFHSDKPVPLSS
jgi:hypothetical protein